MSKYFALLGLLKLTRVFRLGKLIAGLHTKKSIKTALKLGKLVFLLLVYLHCQGCLWFYIINLSASWQPEGDGVLGTTFLYEESLTR